jgi:hypothetical protein
MLTTVHMEPSQAVLDISLAGEGQRGFRSSHDNQIRSALFTD